MSIEPIAMGEIQPEATLEDCEQALHTVERNAAIQQGVILRHVRNHRLYSAAGFPSFAEYVEQRLGYTDRWARQRIDLADTVAAIGTMVPDHAIENERQARAIKPILRDHGPEVAADVLAEAEASGKITARSITEAAERVIEPEVISAEQWMAREGYAQPDELAARRTTDAERERFRAEDKAKAIRQRNLDVNVAFTAIDELTNPDILAEVQAHWQPLAQHWTAARLHQLADTLHAIADQWKVIA
jgi:hypothetical protein